MYDFLPQDPTSPATAAALLSGGSVPGARLRLRLAAPRALPPAGGIGGTRGTQAARAAVGGG
jgi:hypothetical protein